MRVRRQFHTVEKLNKLADKCGVAPADDWYGFTYNEKKILYRYGRPEEARATGYKYPNSPIFNWPFGRNSDDRNRMDYVLLQADLSGGRGYFYLLPVSDAAHLADLHPKRTFRIVRNAKIKSHARDISEMLEKYRLDSIDAVKKKLE